MRIRAGVAMVLALAAACAADKTAPPGTGTSAPPPAVAQPAPFPLLFGDRDPVEDGAILRASGADSRVVLWMLGRDAATGFVATGGRPLTGVAAAPNRALLFDELAKRPDLGGEGTDAPALRTARVGSGKGPRVSISDPEIRALAVLERLAGPLGATKVITKEDAYLPVVSIHVREAPADAVLAAIAEITGTKFSITQGLLVMTGDSMTVTDPTPVAFGFEGDGLASATLLATVVEARRGQALFRDEKGFRVATRAGGAIEIRDGVVRSIATGEERRVAPPVAERTTEATKTVFGVTRDGPAENPKSGGKNGGRKNESEKQPKSPTLPIAQSAATPATDESGGGSGGSGDDGDSGKVVEQGDAPFDFGDERDRFDRPNPKPAVSPVAGPTWAVEPFGEKAGWLGGQEAALAKRHRGDSWGDAFALALERALREKGRNATAVPGKLTAGQVERLVKEEMLRWIVAGELQALEVKGSRATLSVGVQVRKQAGGKMKVVDARTIAGAKAVTGAVPTDAEMAALLHATATTVAEAVALSIPADLLAGRN